MQKRKHRSIVTAVVGLLRTTPQYGRGPVEGTAVAMGKIQTCQYCGKQGHNARSCPVLGLKVLKKLQVKHSVTAVTKAIMDGCEPLTVPGIERRRGSRKAARRLEHRRVRQVHKGTRGRDGQRRSGGFGKLGKNCRKCSSCRSPCALTGSFLARSAQPTASAGLCLTIETEQPIVRSSEKS